MARVGIHGVNMGSDERRRCFSVLSKDGGNELALVPLSRQRLDNVDGL
jgi:hypothetical protein